MITFQPPIIAHRGASLIAPENTMIAFVKAVQSGVKWVEFDVMHAADGEPIIFHDDRLDRTTTGRGDIEQHPYSYLKTLDAGGWFHPYYAGECIPTLKMVLAFLKEMHLSANIELKSDHPGSVPRVLQVLAEAGLTSHNQILFSSFTIPTLYTLRKLAPEANIGLLMHEWLPNWEEVCRELRCCSVHLNIDILTHERVKKIKNSGLLVLCYTVNQPSLAKTCFRWGVDAIFSDDPNVL